MTHNTPTVSLPDDTLTLWITPDCVIDSVIDCVIDCVTPG